jgi:hypothetical protein
VTKIDPIEEERAFTLTEARSVSEEIRRRKRAFAWFIAAVFVPIVVACVVLVRAPKPAPVVVRVEHEPVTVKVPADDRETTPAVTERPDDARLDDAIRRLDARTAAVESRLESLAVTLRVVNESARELGPLLQSMQKRIGEVEAAQHASAASLAGAEKLAHERYDRVSEKLAAVSTDLQHANQELHALNREVQGVSGEVRAVKANAWLGFYRAKNE